jgi:ADP-heptose:LPS heptosyltransferase
MRILAVRLSALGDVILSTPVLEYLSKKGELHFLTYPENAEIFAEDPRINRVWKIKRKAKFGEIKEFAEMLWEQKYDLFVDLQVKPITLLLSKLLGIKTLRVRKMAVKRRLHVWFGINFEFGIVWKRYLEDVARYFGERAPEIYPKIYPREVFLPFDIPENFVSIFPEASSDLKRWPFTKFVELGKRLLSLGFKVVWMGRESFPNVNFGLDLRGKTDISQTIKVVSLSRMVISNDSAPIHIARALNVPAVMIMGPTSRSLGFVYDGIKVVERGLKCRPCSTNGSGRCWRGDRLCLEGIEVEDVLKAVLSY